MNKHSFYEPYFFNKKVHKSSIDSSSIEMKFLNKTEKLIVLYWIDYKGDYYDFCILKPKESIKIMSNIKNYWFSREMETGLFLNFLDRHSKIEHKHLLCSGSDVDNYETECQFQCIDIKECSQTLYDLALLSIVKNGLYFKINKYELPRLLIADIYEVKYFMEENSKFCSDLMKC